VTAAAGGLYDGVILLSRCRQVFGDAETRENEEEK